MIIDNKSNIQAYKQINQGGKKIAKEKDMNLGATDGFVQASYYANDPFVAKPVLTQIPANGLSAGPDNARIDVNANTKPDANGNFIFEPNDPNFVNVQTFASTDKPLNMIQNYLGKEVKWHGGEETLGINPDKGEMKNAYYYRADMTTNFFHFTSKKGEKIFTGKSFEIVAHETGHAVLDGLKPGYMGWDKESGGFHEGFADTTAMLASFQEPSVREQFLKETGGDFRKDNLISNLGEEFGNAVYGKPVLRTSINNYTYSPPDTLPEHPAPGQLGGEAHSFGQLMVGAMYDVMEGIFKANVAEGMNQEDALKNMTDTFGKLFYKSVDGCPPSVGRYKDLAASMIKVDKASGGKYNKTLTDTFKKRNLMSANAGFAEEGMRTQGVFLNSTNPDGVLSFVDKNRDAFGIKDGAELNLSKTDKNKDGSENFDVTYKKEVPLNGKEYGKFDGAVVEVERGVNLVTGFDGRVSSESHSSLTPEDEANLQKDMKKYIADGKILFVPEPTRAAKLNADDFFDKETGALKYMGYATYEDGKLKIFKSPVIQ